MTLPSDDVAPLTAGNPAVKRLRKLVRSSKDRRAEHVIVVEGPRALETAVEAGAEIDTAFVEVDRHGDLVARLADGGISCRTVDAGVLDKALSAVSPQPIAAIVHRPSPPMTLPPASSSAGPLVLLAGVGDPGNVGTIVRSAVASGAGPIIVGPDTADPYGPKAVRASAGTVFHTSVLDCDDVAECLDELRGIGWTVVGAAPRVERSIHEADLVAPHVLVLGGETSGLPEGVADGELVGIPQTGPAESLNVAMAATVVLFEVARQRAAAESP